MTDNEIIKALECCISPECENCPYDGDDLLRPCNHNLMKDALDLINLQNEEIERLLKAINDKHCVYEKRVVTEAIKEFAGRFERCTEAVVKGIYKEHPVFNELPYEIETEYRMSKCRFDNLVKEMVGDAE